MVERLVRTEKTLYSTLFNLPKGILAARGYLLLPVAIGRSPLRGIENEEDRDVHRDQDVVL